MEYDEITAYHYAAWRPPLHGRILRWGLGPGVRFVRGLDVGCGTGVSTLALKTFCKGAVGVDPSPDMIGQAPQHPGVDFAVFAPENSLDHPVFADRFDVVTFAGSLFYTRAGRAVELIKRVALPGASVLVYDFDVRLDSLLSALGLHLPDSDYNHRKDLGRARDVQKVKTIAGQMNFTATPVQVAHLLLSVAEWRERVFPGVRHPALTDRLYKNCGGERVMSARVYLTRYRV